MGRDQTKECHFYKQRQKKRRDVSSGNAARGQEGATTAGGAAKHKRSTPPTYDTVIAMAGPPHKASASAGGTAAVFALDDSLPGDAQPQPDLSKMWMHARLTRLGRQRTTRFVRLLPSTNLHVPPPHYLRLDREACVHRQAPGYARDHDKALRGICEVALRIDRPSTGSGGSGTGKPAGAPVVAAGEETLRRIVLAILGVAPLSIDVHRVADVAVLDAGLEPEVRGVTSPGSHHRKALTAKLLYRMTDPSVHSTAPAFHAKRGGGPSHARIGTSSTHQHTQLVAPDSTAHTGAVDVRCGVTTNELSTETVRPLPRVTTLSTTNLNDNAGEEDHQYANVVRWQLGDSDLVLGIDRPLFIDDTAQDAFPIVLLDSDAHVGRDIDAALAWTIARLMNSQRLAVCRHSGGHVVGYEVIPVSSLGVGEFAGGDLLKGVLGILRWVAQNCTDVGRSYVVRQQPGVSTLCLSTRAPNDHGEGVSMTPVADSLLLGVHEGARRHRTTVALLFAAGAHHCIERHRATGRLERHSHHALLMFTRAANGLLASLAQSFNMRLAALRQNAPSPHRVASLTREPEEVAPLVDLLQRLPDLIADLLQPSDDAHTSLGTSSSVAVAWVTEVVTMGIRCLHSALASVRDLPPLLVAANDRRSEALQAASDQVAGRHVAVGQLVAMLSAVSASRVAALTASAVHGVAAATAQQTPFELAAIAKVAVVCVAAMEAVDAACDQSSVQCPPPEGAAPTRTTIAISSSDASLRAMQAELGAAIREHTADLLVGTLPLRRDIAQLYRVAAEAAIGDVTHRGRFGLFGPATGSSASAAAAKVPSTVNVLQHCRLLAQAATDFDPVATGMRCLRLLSSAQAATARHNIKTARVHYALGSLHRSHGRLTKALDALSLSRGLLRVLVPGESQDPPLFPVAEEEGVQLLGSLVQVELAALHRERAVFERTAAADAARVPTRLAPLGATESEFWERAVNCLREEVRPSSPSTRRGQEKQSRDVEGATTGRVALGATTLLYVTRVIEDHEATSAAGKRGSPEQDARWFVDVLERLELGERLITVPPANVAHLRLRVLRLALDSCKSVGSVAGVHAVLAARQMWGTRAWSVFKACRERCAGSTLPETRPVGPDVADADLRQTLTVTLVDGIRVRLATLRLLLDFNLLSSTAWERREGDHLPTRFELAVEVVDCLVAIDSDPAAAAVWPVARNVLLQLAHAMKATGSESPNTDADTAAGVVHDVLSLLLASAGSDGVPYPWADVAVDLRDAADRLGKRHEGISSAA